MTRAEIEALALAETPTGRLIVQFFLERGNRPADYFELMHLGNNGSIAGVMNRLMEVGLLELCPHEKRSIMLVRLRDYDPG